MVHLRTLELTQELPRVGAQRLDVPALPLGVERVEREARFPRAGGAGEHDELALGDREAVDRKVVLARADDLDEVGLPRALHGGRSLGPFGRPVTLHVRRRKMPRVRSAQRIRMLGPGARRADERDAARARSRQSPGWERGSLLAEHEGMRSGLRLCAVWLSVLGGTASVGCVGTTDSLGPEGDPPVQDESRTTPVDEADLRGCRIDARGGGCREPSRFRDGCGLRRRLESGRAHRRSTQGPPPMRASPADAPGDRARAPPRIARRAAVSPLR